MNRDEAGSRIPDYLAHMLEATRLASTYVEGMAKVEFLADRRTQQAVILNLITIGEAAARVVTEYPDFAAVHPEVPWAQMRGMRNRMAHGYFDINLDTVWETVQTSLPDLEEKLRKIDTPRGA
jgi:uncharacterized protein with HEPN domain